MLILGIETTCDETGCAIVRDGSEILSNVVYSQEELHSHFGGVVPELASRRHLDVLPEVLEKALKKAHVSLGDIDAIAVAHTPGLMGALLVGINFAKGLALSLGKPLVGVNHVEAHLFASLLEKESEPQFPALGVVISGGHTALLLIDEKKNFKLIGKTQDDAIGEAFDKVAKLLELPYPGGPNIEKLAKEGNPHRYPFKCGNVKNRPFDFSFSGLKTAVFYLVKGQNAQKNSPFTLSEADKKDVAASFQSSAFSDLVKKILLAAKEYACQCILLGGGVSQNLFLRDLLEKKSLCPLFWPSKGLCLDNGAMIAALGYRHYINGENHLLKLDAEPKISFLKDSDETLHLPSFTLPPDSISHGLMSEKKTKKRGHPSPSFEFK